MSVLNIHENLLEALLEIQAYSEVQVIKTIHVYLEITGFICETHHSYFKYQ